MNVPTGRRRAARGERQAEHWSRSRAARNTVLERQQRIAPQVGMLVKFGLPLGYSRSIQPICAKPEAAPHGNTVALDVVHVEMVGTVTAAPGERAVLQGHRAEDHIKESQAPVRLVRAMSPHSR